MLLVLDTNVLVPAVRSRRGASNARRIPAQVQIMTKARVSLNLPASLKAAAEDFAQRDGVSLNQFIALALAKKVGAFSASEFFSEHAGGADRARALDFLRAPQLYRRQLEMNSPTTSVVYRLHNCGSPRSVPKLR